GMPESPRVAPAVRNKHSAVGMESRLETRPLVLQIPDKLAGRRLPHLGCRGEVAGHYELAVWAESRGEERRIRQRLQAGDQLAGLCVPEPGYVFRVLGQGPAAIRAARMRLAWGDRAAGDRERDRTWMRQRSTKRPVGGCIPEPDRGRDNAPVFRLARQDRFPVGAKGQGEE